MKSQELLQKLQYLIDKKKITSIKELGAILELEEYEVRGLIDMLIINGALLAVNNESVIKLKKPLKNDDVYEIPSNLTHIKLLLISDTHLASKYDRIDILEYLYDKAEKEGVKYVLHSGDFTDGKSHRPEHQYELRELSYQGQADYAIDKYPKREGITTFVINGN